MTDFRLTTPNLIITGYIRTNQEILLQTIARHLNLPYVNLDMLVAERMGTSIEQIRIYFGETRLKAVETEIIEETTLRRNSLIRISGRALAHSDNLAKMQATGSVFYLRISLNAMLSRLHVAMGARYHNPDERALVLGTLKREWSIANSPNLIDVDTTYLTDEEIIDTITTQWRDLSIIRG